MTQRKAEIEQALSMGRTLAQDVLRFRDVQLQLHEAALLSVRRAAARHGGDVAPAAAAAPIAAFAGAGILIAQGDAWFDYPLHDVLRLLEDLHAFDVQSVARRCERIEELAYGVGQLEELTRLLEKALARGTVPRAVLLSGGGDDLSGETLQVLLNHVRAPAPGLNADIVRGVVDQRIRDAYLTLLSAITQVCIAKVGRPLPILIHGYDYPVPDGRAFAGSFGGQAGPWLEPAFRSKGYDKRFRRIQLATRLIDRFNGMLAAVAELPELAHVRHVDLRGTLSSGTDYRDWWANELYPTADGFRAVAARFAAALEQLP